MIKGLPEKYPEILRNLFLDMIEPDSEKRKSIYYVVSKLQVCKIYSAKMQIIFDKGINAFKNYERGEKAICVDPSQDENLNMNQN